MAEFLWHKRSWTKILIAQKHFHHLLTIHLLLFIYHLNVPTHLFKFNKWFTLDNDISCGMYGIHIIGGKTCILSSILLDNILDIKPSGGGDVDANIIGQRCPVSLCPGDSRLWLACGTALQRHTLSHQDLSVLGLYHKTWSCWRSRHIEKGRVERLSWCRFFPCFWLEQLRNWVLSLNP